MPRERRHGFQHETSRHGRVETAGEVAFVHAPLNVARETGDQVPPDANVEELKKVGEICGRSRNDRRRLAGALRSLVQLPDNAFELGSDVGNTLAFEGGVELWQREPGGDLLFKAPLRAALVTYTRREPDWVPR